MAYNAAVKSCGNCPFNHSTDEINLSKGEFICWLDDDNEVDKTTVSSFSFPLGCPLKKYNTVTITIGE